MLVKLKSSTAGEMLMFAEHLRLLFVRIGKECSARGVFTEEQLPAAIANLRRAIEDEKRAAKCAAGKARCPPPAESATAPDAEDEEKKEEEAPVGFVQRAAPLLTLLERTQKEGGYVLWEAPHDF